MAKIDMFFIRLILEFAYKPLDEIDRDDIQNKINPGFHDVDENLIKSEDL